MGISYHIYKVNIYFSWRPQNVERETRKHVCLLQQLIISQYQVGGPGPHCKPCPNLNSHLTQEGRKGRWAESGSTESNMLHRGRIQVRKSKETEKYKCASCGAYFTQRSRIQPPGVKQELRSGPGLQCILSNMISFKLFCLLSLQQLGVLLNLAISKTTQDRQPPQSSTHKTYMFRCLVENTEGTANSSDIRKIINPTVEYNHWEMLSYVCCRRCKIYIIRNSSHKRNIFFFIDRPRTT